MKNTFIRRVGVAAAALACAPIAGLASNNTATASDGGWEPVNAACTGTVILCDNLTPGHHHVYLDGTYRISMYGAAGGYGQPHGAAPHSDHAGMGGYVCWEGEHVGGVDLFIGSHGQVTAGGASTVVRSSSDPSDIIGIAGGGGGQGRAEGNNAGGGNGGRQTQAAPPAGQSFAGGHGQSLGTHGFGGGGGFDGAGGASWHGPGHQTAGHPGIGGAGGDVNNSGHAPGSNGMWTADGKGGRSNSKELGLLWKTRHHAGSGGGGYGGGGGGAIDTGSGGLLPVTAGPESSASASQGWHVGGGGGGGSYVAASPTPCTTDTVASQSTRHGGHDGRVRIERL